jgi:hypothetical protein
LGYPVLLLRSGEKVPALTGGHRKATTDPTTIAEWWKAIPQANVGISTSDLIVLDLDAPDGLSGRTTGRSIKSFKSRPALWPARLAEDDTFISQARSWWKSSVPLTD